MNNTLRVSRFALRETTNSNDVKHDRETRYALRETAFKEGLSK